MKKPKFKILKKEYGDIPFEDIFLKYIVNKINREKGYEFVKIKKEYFIGEENG